MSYQAFITKIVLRPHPNADRLQLATVLGEQVVVGQGMTDNEWVVYFPENGKLSLDYCQENDLFPRFNEAGDRINAGYIDPDNRRVRAQNFRGEKSYGLVMPLSSLTYTAVALTDLMLQADKAERSGSYYGFTEVNGQPICEKYIRYTRGQGVAGKPGKKQDAELGGVFPLYPDTDNLYHQKPESLPQLPAIVTEKLHGTSARYGYVPKIYKGWRGWFNRIIDRWFKRDSYQYVVGTRRTIVENSTVGYYGSESWRIDVMRDWKHKLNRGEVVYGELVGYLPDGRPIMTAHDAGQVKNDKAFVQRAKRYDKPIVYHYGCKPGEHKFFVYRIDQDGQALPFDQMQKRASELGLECVPFLQKTEATGLALVEWAKLMSEGDSTLAVHPREGVCVRFDAPTGVKVFKAKSHNFLIMEGVATEQEVSLEDLA